MEILRSVCFWLWDLDRLPFELTNAESARVDTLVDCMQLLRRLEKAKVDILERLPTPFGLVRSGVAPDHPETKVVPRSCHSIFP